MKQSLSIVIFLVLLSQMATPKVSRDSWELVWSEEFNYSGLPDATKWSYDVGGHGWGNKELQNYTDRRKENARVENGVLIVEARRDGSETQPS